MPYKISENGLCVEKEDGTKVKCHKTHDEALAHLKALQVNVSDAHSFVVDEFVNVRPGEPYRLFPIGTLVKGGVKREITPDFIAQFKLPHFKPPVKLGSHEDTTPAGGHIIGLEVRPDGLYAVPEWNDEGTSAINKGAYRYHSPEVIWEGYLENPTGGAAIEAPLIVGDALLHTPHLGEATAFYTTELQTNKEQIMTEPIQVPVTLWDKFIAPLLTGKPEEQKAAPEAKKPEVDVEKFNALQAERDDYKAKFETQQAELAKKEVISKLTAELQDKEKFGMSFVEAKVAEEAANVLSGMSDEQRAWVMKNFSALSAQIDLSKLTTEKGSEGGGVGDNPAMALNVAVQAKMAEAKVDYNTAFGMVAAEKPELIIEYAK